MLARSCQRVSMPVSNPLIAWLVLLMTYDPQLQHLKSQMVRTPKRFSLTAATTDNTPNYYFNHLIEPNHPLTNICH